MDAYAIDRHRYAAELPPGWRPTRIDEPTLDRSSGEGSLVMTVARPGKGECELYIRAGATAEGLADATSAILDDVTVRRGLAHPPDVEATELTSGSALWAEVYPATGHAELYILKGRDDHFHVLRCQERYRHADEWRLVAESFEFLSQAE